MLHEDYSEERFRYAAALVEESLGINQALDNKVGIAKAFNVLGEIRHELAEYPQAQRLIEDGLSLARLIGSRREEGVALGYLGAWALDLGDYPRAITCLRECLAALDTLGRFKHGRDPGGLHPDGRSRGPSRREAWHYPGCRTRGFEPSSGSGERVGHRSARCRGSTPGQAGRAARTETAKTYGPNSSSPKGGTGRYDL